MIMNILCNSVTACLWHIHDCTLRDCHCTVFLKYVWTNFSSHKPRGQIVSTTTASNINPLSQGRGLLQLPPPHSDFLSCHFCSFAKIAILFNLPTLCPDTHVFMKKNFKNFCHENLGEGVLQQPPPHPERGGVAAKINKFF